MRWRRRGDDDAEEEPIVGHLVGAVGVVGVVRVVGVVGVGGVVGVVGVVGVGPSSPRIALFLIPAATRAARTCALPTARRCPPVRQAPPARRSW